MTDPEVTVIVEQINSPKYNIFGQVGKAWKLHNYRRIMIMDAIAAAGGLRDFAKKKGICNVLRQSPGGERYEDSLQLRQVHQGATPSRTYR